VIGLNIVLAFKLVKPTSYGIAGLALAQSIAAFTEIVLLFLIMFLKDPYLLNRAFWGAILRIVSVTGFSVLAAFVMVSLLPLRIADRGFVTLGFKFGLIAGVTLLVHLCMSALFGLEEAKVVIKKAYRVITSSVRIQ